MSKIRPATMLTEMLAITATIAAMAAAAMMAATVEDTN